MYRIGSLANTDAKLITPRRVNWSNKTVNTLGVNLFNQKKERDVNIIDVINKMKTVANMWYYSTMTLSGKIVIINSLMSSLFVYRMQVLPVVSDYHIKLIEDVILQFLWHGKRAKISWETLKCKKEQGGLGLIDIWMKHRALLFNWICDIECNPKIQNLACFFLGNRIDDGKIWEYNINKFDSVNYFPGDSFWHSLVHTWHEYNYYKPQNDQNVCDQILYYNSNIKINGKLIREGSMGDMRRIGQIFESGRFLTYLEIIGKLKNLGSRFSWLKYKSVITAIPGNWKYFLLTPGLIDSHIPKHAMIKGCTKVSRIVYQDMIQSEVALRSACATWCNKLPTNYYLRDYAIFFCNINKLMPTTKLRDFQFCLLHNKIFCNNVLVHWKKFPSNICNLCQTSKQDILHLMFHCSKVRPIWM